MTATVTTADTRAVFMEEANIGHFQVAFAIEGTAWVISGITFLKRILFGGSLAAGSALKLPNRITDL